MPKCCSECGFFKSGQSIESMWCKLGINYLHQGVNFSRDERCILDLVENSNDYKIPKYDIQESIQELFMDTDFYKGIKE